jgi:L-ascorbate metabolism protein UlaG (beta-lactamase superfamily)
MDVKRAAELVNIIRPEYAIPTHYGSIVGKKTDGKAFAELVSSPVKVIEKIQYFE